MEFPPLGGSHYCFGTQTPARIVILSIFIPSRALRDPVLAGTPKPCSDTGLTNESSYPIEANR
jgi:hypothetical protein